MYQFRVYVFITVIYEAPELPIVTSVVSVDISSIVHGYHELIVTINVRLLIMSNKNRPNLAVS